MAKTFQVLCPARVTRATPREPGSLPQLRERKGRLREVKRPAHCPTVGRCSVLRDSPSGQTPEILLLGKRTTKGLRKCGPAGVGE